MAMIIGDNSTKFELGVLGNLGSITRAAEE